MYKYLLSTLLLVTLSSCSLFNLSNNDAPTNFETLMSYNENKKITYSCSFNGKMYEYPQCTFVQKCSTGGTCFAETDLDYVSFYTSFNFQSHKILANDYLMNLTKSLEKDDKPIQREYVSVLFNPVKRSFYDEDSKNLLYLKMNFDNYTPASFVTKYNDNITVFLSKKDIFLRTTIYPSLKILGIKGDFDLMQYFSESYIQYQIYPHTMSVAYNSDFISSLLGVPRISENDNDIDVMEKYFKEISMYLDKIEEHTVKTILPSEKARPFVFKDKIEKLMDEGVSGPIYPYYGDEGSHLVNEFLPKYSLEKIDIVIKNAMHEKVLKTYTKENINELLISNDEIAGFAYQAKDVGNNNIIIRYYHNAEPPKEKYLSKFKMQNSGLETVYKKLRKVIVTDLVAEDQYELTSLPVKCLENINAKEIMSKSGILGKDKEEAMLSLFKNTQSQCSPFEEFMAKVIFKRDFRE